MQLQLKTHQPGRTIATTDLFILSKGNNAGKPLFEPCPNCFFVSAHTPAEREQLYWLCYAMWKADKFRLYINGSVIPFIHIRDAQRLINDCWQRVAFKGDKFNARISALANLNALQANLHHQLKMSEELKRTIAHHALTEL